MKLKYILFCLMLFMLVGCEDFFEPEPPSICGIEIDTSTVKKEYSCGEDLCLDNLKVYLVYEDDSKELTDKYVVNHTFDGSVAGEYVIEVVINKYKETFTVTVSEDNVCGIEIDYSQVKTSYAYNEVLDLSNLVVYMVSMKGNKEITEDYTINHEFNGMVAGTYTITIFLNNTTYFDTFEVVVDNPQVIDLFVDCTGVKTNYAYGEALDLSGLSVYELYADQLQKLIDTYVISHEYNAFVAGVYTITVSINDNAYFAEFKVTVNEAQINGIRIDTENVKKSYEYGEEFDAYGLEVYELYEDGTEKLTDAYNLTHEINPGVPGDYKVILSLKIANFSDNFIVTVKDFDPTKEVKILAIGNSYSYDATQWLWQILNDMGVEKVVVGHLHIGGTSLQDHANNARGEKPVYQFLVNTNGEFVVEENVTSLYGIGAYDWDFITLQQLSATSGIASSYDEDLTYMANYVRDNCTNPYVKLLWHMNWSWPNYATQADFANYDNDQMVMYEAITAAVSEKIVASNLFDGVIPSGSAIQNARTSFLGDTLNRDNYHLSLYVGRYIAALTYAAYITGLPLDDLSYVPSTSEMDENILLIAKESVINALSNPFEVTNSIYQDISSILTGYRELNWMPVVSGYWESTTSANFITGTAVSKNLVASSIKFTPNTLPVGSIITINAGYKYRPEAWVDEAIQSSRPDYVTTYYLRIDEAWWGNYKTRAFNIMTNAFTSVIDCAFDVVSAFHIYVPDNTESSLTTYDDSNVLAAAGYDINNYEHFDWIATCGWLNSISKGAVINTGDSLSKSYIVSKWMNASELPIGTILVLDNGYSLRPEGYFSGMASSNRPVIIKNATGAAKVIEVDETWWNKYTLRALQIHYNTASVFKGDIYSEKSHLRVYLPK